MDKLGKSYEERKYADSAVKMLVTALDDLHMIKFKQGWFTLIKYDYQVGEKKNDQPRIEMIEFVNKVRQEGISGPFQGLAKPSTWLSQLDLKIENKFKQEFIENKKQFQIEDYKIDSVQKIQNVQGPLDPNSQKPKSQSKVALKKQRAALQNSSLLKNDSAKVGTGILSLKKKMNLKLGKDAIDEEDKIENRENPNSNSGSEKVHDLEIKEDDLIQLRQQFDQINQEDIQINSKLPEKKPNFIIEIKEEPRHQQNKSEQLIHQDNQKQQLQLNIEVKKQEIKEEKSIERSQNFLKSKLFQKVDLQIKNQITLNNEEINANKLQQKQKENQIAQKLQQNQQDKMWNLSQKMNKLIKHKYFIKLIQFIVHDRQQDFINRILRYDMKTQINKMKKAFYKMKINYLRQQVIDNAQEQFQLNIKSARFLVSAIIKSIWSKDQQFIKKQQYFKNWVYHTQQLKSIVLQADDLRKFQERQSQKIEDSTQTRMTDSVYMHVNTINILQNQENIYLKELELEDMQNQELIIKNNQLSKLAVNKTKFYALLLSKIQYVAKCHLQNSFMAIYVLAGKDSIGSQSLDNSINSLSKIRANISYLRKVQRTLQGKTNISLQNYQARKQSAIQGSIGTAPIFKQSQIQVASGSGQQIKQKPQLLIQENILNQQDQVDLNDFQTFNQFDKKTNSQANQQIYQKQNISNASVQILNKNQISNFQAIEQQNRSNLGILPLTGQITSQQNQEPALQEQQQLQKNDQIQSTQNRVNSSGQKMTDIQNKIKRIQIKSIQSDNDNDTSFLLQIEKQLSENIGLLKLLKDIKINDDRQVHQNRDAYQQSLSSEQIESKLIQNKGKVIAIRKLLNLVQDNQCLQLSKNGNQQLSKEQSCKLYVSWSKWVTMTNQYKISSSILKTNYQQHQILKQSVSLILSIFNKNNSLSSNFHQWHKVVIIQNYQLKNPLQDYTQNMIQMQNQKDEADNMIGQKYNQQSQQIRSASLTFQEQKMFYKMSSFMRIKQILLKHFIQKGTVLQKYIDMLKYLAKEQNRIFSSSNQYNSIVAMSGQRRKQNGIFQQSSQQKQISQDGIGQHGYLSKRAQEEQNLIEENVTKIIKVIFGIVFSKWVVFTYKMNKDVKFPKEKGIQQIFNTIDNSINRSKLFSLTQIHHYSLYVYQASSLNLNQPNPIISQNSNQVKLIQSRGSIQDKIQRSNFSVYIMKSIIKRNIYKLLNQQFHKWKQNCLVIEWRMNQSLQETGLNPFGPVETLEDGQKRSDALEKILENIRDKDLNSSNINRFNQNDPNLHKQQIKQMVSDFKNAKNSDAVRQFFENYYTPKSAAVQQQLQKPWEIKLQRDTLKQVSIYRGAMRSEQLLSKQFMPTRIDKTFKPLLNINFARIKMSKSFVKWRNVVYFERNLVGYKEKKQFMKILNRIQMRKIVKKFVYWKYMKVADDPYPTQCEQIDQQVLNTLSVVGKELSIQQKNLRYIYKDQVKKKVISKIFDFMQKQNPTRESFKQWKQQVAQIVQSKHEILASLEEKDELLQQYTLISIQNKEMKEERLQNIIGCTDCNSCQEMQKNKLDELSEITFNEKNYRVLANLIGLNGIKTLLGDQNNVHLIFYNKSNSTPISMQSSSQDNSFIRLVVKDKSQSSLNYKQPNLQGIRSKNVQIYNEPYQKI